MQEKINKLKILLEKSKNILLINHIRMDPDAFWSLSAFYYILKKLWKNIKAINDEIRPDNFSFLDENQIFEPNLNIKEFNPDLIISFDAASIGQLGETYIKNENIFKNTNFIVIDHHITNSWFWDLNIIDTKASSTCELVFEIIENFNWIKYTTPKIATLLNAWMLTDTNMYFNQNTTSKTLKTASKLLELWSNFRAPIYEFFKKKSFQKTKLFWIALGKIEKQWNIVYTSLSKNDFLKAEATDQDTNWIIDMMINIDWAEIAFIIYTLDKWWNKVSFRSKNFNVWEFCEKFWWWGHKLAAWFSSEKESKELTKEILNEIKNQA
jgi:phosphoesterase RecJ-like protein